MHVERDEEQDDGEGHCDEAAAFDEGLLLLVELCVALGVMARLTLSRLVQPAQVTRTVKTVTAMRT